VLQEYGRSVRRDHRLPVPPADSVSLQSSPCGSRLTLDALIRDGRIEELGYRVRACSLGQATTAILARRAPGLGEREIREIGAELREILAGERTRSSWPELDVFAAASAISSRHGSALLPFEALESLFDRARQREPGSAGATGPPTDQE